MTKQELYRKYNEYKEKKVIDDNRLKELQEKFERIRTVTENLGTLPTLSKLRELLQTIKDIIKGE